MGFLDRRLKQAEGDTEALIQQYMKLADESVDAASVKQMARSGAPSDSVGERAADTHQSLFGTLLASAGRSKVLKSKARQRIVEQFCVTLWRKWIGDDSFRVMAKRLNFTSGPPQA